MPAQRLFLITSVADPGLGVSFRGGASRSVFDTQQRLAQTRRTLENLTCMDPGAVKLIVDASWRRCDQLEPLAQEFGAELQHMEDWDPKTRDHVVNHPNKSHCEARMITSIIHHLGARLRQPDHIIKLTARYWFEHWDAGVLDHGSGWYFQPEMSWPLVDLDYLRGSIPDQLVHKGCYTGYHTVCYGLSRLEIDQWLIIMSACAALTDTDQIMYQNDMEYVVRWIMRTVINPAQIHAVPWRLQGHGGGNGRLFAF